MNEKSKEEARRLADYAGTSTVYEGDVVPMADIENRVVTISNFNFADSSYKPGEKFLSMQAALKDKELFVLNTNAKVILKGFLNVPKEVLPDTVVFYMEKPKGGGKPYWNMRTPTKEDLAADKKL